MMSDAKHISDRNAPTQLRFVSIQAANEHGVLCSSHHMRRDFLIEWMLLLQPPDNMINIAKLRNDRKFEEMLAFRASFSVNTP